MSSSFMAQLPWIGEATTLGWACDETAKSYMKFIRMRIDHILPLRGWHIGTLKEFYPRARSLLGLNINKGSEICVRFRIPGTKNAFLPFHEVLCTTLHELAHCEISRHDASFWALYYDLVRECERLETALVAQGAPLYPPQTEPQDGIGTKQPKPRAPQSKSNKRNPKTPAASDGTRYGGLATIHTIRDSLNAGPAQPVFTGKGHRLGSSNPPVSGRPSTPSRLDLRSIMASAAEQRLRLKRLTAEATPAHSSHAPPEEEEGLPDVIPPSQAKLQDNSWCCARCGSWNEKNLTTCAACTDVVEDEVGTNAAGDLFLSLLEAPSLPSASPVRKRSRLYDEELPWACAHCTLLNEDTFSQCEMCGAVRTDAGMKPATATVSPVVGVKRSTHLNNEVTVIVSDDDL